MAGVKVIRTGDHVEDDEAPFCKLAIEAWSAALSHYYRLTEPAPRLKVGISQQGSPMIKLSLKPKDDVAMARVIR